MNLPVKPDLDIAINKGMNIGGGHLVVIAGPCVAESKELCLKVAAGAMQACMDLGLKYIFKASFDKANRTSISSFRGPGEQAGLEILEARITYLAYAPEIAAVMLQRQQASAIIDARKMIVDGAVGMVEMALERLNENDVVHLDEERKAAMVSNLLVVLCGNHDAQPVVNSGSLY